MDAAVSSTQTLCFFKPKVPFPPSRNGYPRNFRTNPRMLVKTMELGRTCQVLDEIPLSDAFAWNNIIHEQLSGNDPGVALAIYQYMLHRGVRPNRRAFPRVLTACRVTGELHFGLQLHGQALKLGFWSDPYVVTALIGMYGNLDSVDVAKKVFDKSVMRNSVSWTMLARLYLAEGVSGLVVQMFYEMVDASCEVDSVALATAIGACGALKSLHDGKNVHEIAKQRGLEFELLVSNSLLKMYIGCDSIEDARVTFQRMPMKDVVSWTEMIRGYVKKGSFHEALKLFRQMNMGGVRPDAHLISSVLPACARTSAHKNGKEIHGYLLRNGMNGSLMIQNTLVDMYVKSGFLEYASEVFGRMKVRDAFSWTIMIFGFSLHGKGELGVECFRRMEKDPSLEIDQLAYEAVLHSCATAGMVEEGKFYFSCITKTKLSHYALMVRLLGRAGLFDEAKTFIKEHHIERHREVLRELLNGCRIHRQKEIGKLVIEKLCQLEPNNGENYVLLGNWYATYGKHDIVDELNGTIKDMSLKTRKAYSWIEFSNKVHVFGTGDVSHPRSRNIYRELQSLMDKMETEAYILSSDYGFHDVDGERECIQIGHSEMLALSFGLLNTQPGRTIRITKNSRLCQSCHDFAKVVSTDVQREIILKDPNCFHHIRDGRCSCRDVW